MQRGERITRRDRKSRENAEGHANAEPQTKTKVRFRIRVGSPIDAVHARYAGKISEMAMWGQTGRADDGTCLKEKAQMARSEAEKQRIMEEEDRELHLPWMTWGEYRALSSRQQSHENQKYTQPAMTYLGCHKTCKLSSCRRARACRGFLSEAQYREGGYHDAFPPCLGKGAPLHQAALEAMRTGCGRRPAADDTPKYAGRPSDRGETE
jgi:hypothetical protein